MEVGDERINYSVSGLRTQTNRRNECLESQTKECLKRTHFEARHEIEVRGKCPEVKQARIVLVSVPG